MKYSIIIAEKNALSSSDTKAWIEISAKLQQTKVQATSVLKKSINQIISQFPEIPNTMVWESYLIFEEHRNAVVIDIDYENIDLLKNEILNIALHNDLAVFIGKENKIYRNISDIK